MQERRSVGGGKERRRRRSGEGEYRMRACDEKRWSSLQKVIPEVKFKPRTHGTQRLKPKKTMLHTRSTCDCAKTPIGADSSLV